MSDGGIPKLNDQPAISGEMAGLLLDIREQWDLTEETLKLAEQTVGAAVMPAIKELRYAGRRLADALPLLSDAEKVEECRQLLVDARFDCFRARHDAIDASTESMLGRLDAALTKLGPDIVDKFFPEAFNLAAALTEVRERIALSRKDRENRDLIYASIHEVHLGPMLATFSKFMYSRDRMMHHARRSRTISIIRDAVLILSLLVGALALASNFMGGRSGSDAKADVGAAPTVTKATGPQAPPPSPVTP